MKDKNSSTVHQTKKSTRIPLEQAVSHSRDWSKVLKGRPLGQITSPPKGHVGTKVGKVATRIPLTQAYKYTGKTDGRIHDVVDPMGNIRDASRKGSEFNKTLPKGKLIARNKDWGPGFSESPPSGNRSGTGRRDPAMSPRNPKTGTLIRNGKPINYRTDKFGNTRIVKSATQIGPRGGHYYVTENGTKVYV